MLRSRFAGLQLEHGDAAVAAADETIERASENRLGRRGTHRERHLEQRLARVERFGDRPAGRTGRDTLRVRDVNSSVDVAGLRRLSIVSEQTGKRVSYRRRVARSPERRSRNARIIGERACRRGSGCLHVGRIPR